MTISLSCTPKKQSTHTNELIEGHYLKNVHDQKNCQVSISKLQTNEARTQS